MCNRESTCEREFLKVLAEALAWKGTAVEAFGLAALDVALLIGWMRADLGSSNAGVRNGAIALLATAHRQLGPGLAPMLSQHVKPALMATLEAAFKANPVAQVHCPASPATRDPCHARHAFQPAHALASARHTRPDLPCSRSIGFQMLRMTTCPLSVLRGFLHPEEACKGCAVQVVPTRKVRGKAPAGAVPARRAKGASAAAQAGEAPAAALDPQDLLPRADISGAITPNLADRFGRCGAQSAAAVPRSDRRHARCECTPVMQLTRTVDAHAVPSGRNGMLRWRRWTTS